MSSNANTASSSSSSPSVANVTVCDGPAFLSTQIDLAFMSQVFPTKAPEKLKSWVSILRADEIETVRDLDALDPAAWGESLQLPLGVRSTLRKYISDRMQALLVSSSSVDASSWVDVPPNAPAAATAAAETETTPIQVEPPADIVSPDSIQPIIPQAVPDEDEISQIDIVVIDISSSMKARSNIDVDKTREDVSKMLFHTIMDKLLSLELSHVVGLLAFGRNVLPVNITREYERFHDDLGRLDAREHATRLYDSVFAAAEMIETYMSEHPELSSSARTAPIAKRIFVLTDGEDNASTRKPWEVTKFLQDRRIVLDAIPVAGINKVLYSMCTATYGLSFDVTSQEQGINLFEREATLHLAFREEPANNPPAITRPEDLAALEPATAAEVRRVVDIKSAVPQQVFAACMTAAQATSMASSTLDSSSGSGSSSTYHSSSAGQNAKRIMKEYLQTQKEPIDGVEVFVNADDINSWKVAIRGLPAPYEGGIWLLTISFSSSYPFAAPKFKFVTPIYHCNISPDGHICLDKLKESWSPASTIHGALQSIRSLLISPNAMDPLDAYKASAYRDYLNNGDLAYIRDATKHTLDHAGQMTYESFKAHYNLE